MPDLRRRCRSVGSPAGRTELPLDDRSPSSRRDGQCLMQSRAVPNARTERHRECAAVRARTAYPDLSSCRRHGAQSAPRWRGRGEVEIVARRREEGMSLAPLRRFQASATSITRTTVRPPSGSPSDASKAICVPSGEQEGAPS
jgi:hypothetical protein